MIDYTAKDIGTIGNFRFWCQKILPAVYDDSLSYYEVLCKFLEKLNEVIDSYNGYDSVLEQLVRLVEELQSELDAFKEHGFDDYYKQEVQAWIDNNMRFIFEHLITTSVFFGLTSDGYFTAYIPSSWKEISFNTIDDYEDENYGCLTLSY